MRSSTESRPLWALVMAGGAGTRFWPLSRRSRPKQLLPFAGGRSLLAAAVDRLDGLVPPERTLVVTGGDVAAAVREELPMLPPENILAEPVGRDTAACIGWVAWRLAKLNPDATMVVVPADHVIPDGAALRTALAVAAATAIERDGLVTLGLAPTRPETGFGYLDLGPEVGRTEGLSVHQVARFVEKPDRQTAERFLAAGTFRWNAGMFAWTVAAITAAVRTHLPELARGLDELEAAALEVGEASALERVYPLLPKTSIDFGVLEKAAAVWAVAVSFTWSDVGSWPGLAEVVPSVDGTVRLGDVVTVDSSGCVVVSEGPVVATVGVSDLVVVATRDAVLVIPKAQAQRVKELVELLRSSKRDELL